MCNKIIYETFWYVSYKKLCSKPDFKEGLCKYHYTRNIEKQKNWIDRKNYRPATEEDLERGISLKLRSTNQHNIYKVIQGKVKIYSSKQDKYIDSDLLSDFNLFCVKTI